MTKIKNTKEKTPSLRFEILDLFGNWCFEFII